MLGDAAAGLVQTYAKARSTRLGKAVSELIRRASAPPMAHRNKGEVRVIQAAGGTPEPTSCVVDLRQVPNAYLLSAAMHAGLTLLTFDSGLRSLLASDEERAAQVELLRRLRHGRAHRAPSPQAAPRPAPRPGSAW